MFRPHATFVALLLLFSFVIAETSLYIPGFDEQPVSVDVIGVGPDGRTTWQIVPSKPTGTVSSPLLPLTATMVQGPSDAVVHASFPQIDVSLSCALNSGQADCVGQIQQPGMTITTSLRESVKPYLVQGGGSGGSPSSPGPTPAPAPSQSGSLSSTATDDGSGAVAVMTRSGVTGVKVLVGSVVAGMVATLFLV